MTLNEQIMKLQTYKMFEGENTVYVERDDVLKLLEQEPCEDAISRQSAIFLANDLKEDLPDDEHIADMVLAHNEGILEYQTKLSLLPPVTPQPKTGHWSRKTKVDAYDIAGVKTWGIKCQCDRCDFTTIVVEDFGYYKYCPNCGAEVE